MKIPVFHSYPSWQLSGVNTWTMNMIHQMAGSSYEHSILLTGAPKSPQPELDILKLPYSFLDVPEKRSRRMEWQALKQFLEARAPCIYIPNYDFHRSCAIGTLSSKVKVCAVVHSDEDCYYDEVSRLGKDFDAIVPVSILIQEKIDERFPILSSKQKRIPYGIPIRETQKKQRDATGPLRLVYCNRLQQYQKRVFDLPLIVEKLNRAGISFTLKIAGDGPDAVELKTRMQATSAPEKVSFLGKLSNLETVNLMGESHLFLLTSDFEGLPISLLEAMSEGCVPVVYDIESGIKELLTGPLNEQVVPHGSVESFASRIVEHSKDRDRLTKLSIWARSRIKEAHSVEAMAESYTELFDQIMDQDSHRTGKVHKCKDLKISTRAIRYFRKKFLQ